MEKVEVTLNKDPVAKFNTLEKFTEKRLAEINKITKSGVKADKQAIIYTMDDALKLNLQASQEMEKIKKNDDRAVAEKNAVGAQENYQKLLSATAANIGINADDEIIDNISSAIDQLAEKKEIKKAVRENKEEITGDKIEVINEQEATTTVKEEFIRGTSTVKKKILDRNMKKIEKAKTNKDEEAKQKISAAQKKIKELKNTINKDDYEEGDVDVLLDKLDAKMEKAEAALESGDMEKTEDLLKSTDALTNNAKHFIRNKKNNNKSKEQSQDQDIQKDDGNRTEKTNKLKNLYKNFHKDR
jgi:hypothetical protein